MLLEWIMAVIMGYSGAWNPRSCEAEDTACAELNGRLEAQLEELGQSILDESERQGLDPVMVAAIIARESSFIREPCGKRMPLDSVISWEPDGRASDSFTLRWECPHSVWGPQCEKRIFDAEEAGRYLVYSTCSADEVGLMQILPWSQWSRPGAVIPGTEVQLDDGRLWGDEGGRAVDLHGGAPGGWAVPEGTWVLTLTIPDDDDRDDEPQVWSTIITGSEAVDGDGAVDDGAHLTLRDALPETLDGFTDFTIARGLPRPSNERRELMLDFSVNIAIGCGEIADQREEHARDGEDWWDWIGTYNTGSRGSTANAYSRRILGTYAEMCETVISTDGDGNETRLKDVWDNCTAVEEEHGHRR